MSDTRLIIARHGNTFEAGQMPTRVGLKTDLPLVDKGRRQARRLGQALLEQNIIPDIGYSSSLQRTKETLSIALDEMDLGHIEQVVDPIFNEIDYGPDENKIEDDVIARVGEEALELWDAQAIPPQGWNMDVEQIKQNWLYFADMVLDDLNGKTILIVTSNGIARFAPILTGDLDGFCRDNNIKLSTGAYSIMDEGENESWSVTQWNIKPAIL